MSGKVYLVTGAGRGLGLEFVKQILNRYVDATVIATVRSKAKSAAAIEGVAGGAAARVKIFEMDSDNVETIKSAAAAIDKEFPAGIDILIWPISSAIATHSPAQNLESSFRTNVVGPTLVTQNFVSQLRKKQTRTIINITSILGSNTVPLPWPNIISYRVSKAALNMATVTLARTLKPEGFTVVPLHPGWVQTELGGKNAQITPEESISGMLKVIEGLKIEDSGKFLQHDGTGLPW
ncbi:hypothetical protein HDU93_008023 [Gonapodya sp. JEL0774]|nr:hypothetical protein HDU93_008023 [Gonapodya sp. JEL0774]